MAQWAECLPNMNEALGLDPQHCVKPGGMMPVIPVGSEIQGHPHPQSEFKSSLEYMRLCLHINKQKPDKVSRVVVVHAFKSITEKTEKEDLRLRTV